MCTISIRFFVLFVLFSFNLQNFLWAQNNDFILLNNNVKIYGKVKLYNSKIKGIIVQYNDSLNYSLNQIRSIQSCSNEFYVLNIHQRNAKGEIFFKNELVKKFINNNICIYTKNIFYSSKCSYDYFSKQGSAIKEVNYKNLKDALKDNRKSMKELNSARNYNYKRNSLVLSGICIAMIGVSKSLQDFKESGNFIINPFTYAGIIVSFTAYIPHSHELDKTKKAIDYYNSN